MADIVQEWSKIAVKHTSVGSGALAVLGIANPDLQEWRDTSRSRCILQLLVQRRRQRQLIERKVIGPVQKVDRLAAPEGQDDNIAPPEEDALCVEGKLSPAASCIMHMILSNKYSDEQYHCSARCTMQRAVDHLSCREAPPVVS